MFIIVCLNLSTQKEFTSLYCVISTYIVFLFIIFAFFMNKNLFPSL